MAAEGFIRRWDVMCVLKSDQDSNNGEEDSRGAVGATGTTVSKGLCWNNEHA